MTPEEKAAQRVLIALDGVVEGQRRLSPIGVVFAVGSIDFLPRRGSVNVIPGGASAARATGPGWYAYCECSFGPAQIVPIELLKKWRLLGDDEG